MIVEHYTNQHDEEKTIDHPSILIVSNSEIPQQHNGKHEILAISTVRFYEVEEDLSSKLPAPLNRTVPLNIPQRYLLFSLITSSSL